MNKDIKQKLKMHYFVFFSADIKQIDPIKMHYNSLPFDKTTQAPF